MQDGISFNNIVSIKLQMLVEMYCWLIPTILAKFVAVVVKSARKSYPKGGTRASVEQSLTEITTQQ